MIIRKALVALALTGLVFGSTAAAAAVPEQAARVASPVNEAENLRGWFWILGVAGGLAALIFFLTKNSDPVSP